MLSRYARQSILKYLFLIIMMKFVDWYPYYLEILCSLKLDMKKDILSSLILSNLVSNESPSLNNFKKLNNKKILIVGAGPSIGEQSIQKFIKSHANFIIISADGSTELCLKLDIIPDFVVTDLDGDIDSLLSANKLGSVLLIHAHGDNINKILKFVPKFKQFFGTTQIFPLQNIYNFGGFTDGDRCVFLADEFRSAEIWLVGMDFTSSIGYFSKKMKFNFILKKKKLYIGKRLIEMLAKKSDSLLYNVTTFKFNSVIDGAVDYKLK
jgi:2-amino-4-hydroxy-6-hydroxymethyldihydropteridine diphosphokinase